MVINLVKGQKIDLTKSNTSLNNIKVGLGWDSAKAKTGLFSAFTSNIDCDASVLMLKNGKLESKSDIVSFRRLKSKCKSVQHSGDNLTGDGEGDDEQIFIALNDVPEEFDSLVFVVNIFSAASRRQHFGMIKNAYIRVLDGNNEIVRYNLSDHYDNQTSLIVGEIYRHNGEWKFNAIGNGTQDKSITELANRY